MNKSMYWLTPSNTILVLALPEYYEWGDTDNWIDDIVNQLDELHNPITVVFDFQKSTYLPQNVLQKTKTLTLHSHPMVESIILTNLSQTHLAVLNTLLLLQSKTANRWKIVDKLEDVLALVG